jgi:septal ring factor EnvC (AmiA/AmiB activator)
VAHLGRLRTLFRRQQARRFGACAKLATGMGTLDFARSDRCAAKNPAKSAARWFLTGGGVLCCSLYIALAVAASAANPDATEAKLGKVRQQITELQQLLRAQTTQRDSLATRLRDAELTVAGVRSQLETLHAKRAAGEQQRSDLQTQLLAVEKTLEAERDALAYQLRAAYIIGGTAGREEQLKLLFNQQDPARLGRMFAYYSYFGRARAAEIDAIRTQLAHLTELDSELAAANAALAQLEQQAREQLTTLQQARLERARVLHDVERELKGRYNQLAQLKRQEDTLEKLLADLRRVLADFPVTSDAPFEKVKGHLAWPVEGQLLADFGQHRGAGLSWNGVLLAPQRGSKVRAVYFGRVVYADWLPGMGLLTIVEHSGGYLSLYGHNEQLYKSVGDWVAPGDVIASAGDSGGSSRPELYFEIRKGARPLNPHQWMQKSSADR